MAEAAPRTVLVTRPEPGLRDTGSALRKLGWEPCLAPMLRIAPLPLRPHGKISRVVVTSGQSLEALRLALPRTTPLTAVGKRTAEKARALGFAFVDHAAGTADSIISHLGRPECGNALLLATGQGLALELAEALRREGWHVTRRVVYRAQPAEGIDLSARAMLEAGRIAAILFYSPATVRAFLSALGPERAMLGTVRALALSPRIGDALRQAPFADIAIAAKPEERALLALLGPVPQPPPDAPWRNSLS